MARKKKKPNPAEHAIEQATAGGAEYAQEQLASDYFRDWVSEQIAEAEAMRQKDPASVIDDPKQIARNMLQQLRWDIHRDMNARDLRTRLSAIDASDADVPERELHAAFFDGLDAELEADTVREWLADEVAYQMENAREHHTVEARREKIDPFTTIYLTPYGYEAVKARWQEFERTVGVEVGFGGNFINITSRSPDVIERAIRWIGIKNIEEISPEPRRRRSTTLEQHPRRHVRAAEPYLQHGERVRIRIRGAKGQPFEAFWYTIPSAMTPSEVALHFAQTGQPGMVIEIQSGRLKWAFQQSRLAGVPTVTPVHAGSHR